MTERRIAHIFHLDAARKRRNEAREAKEHKKIVDEFLRQISAHEHPAGESLSPIHRPVAPQFWAHASGDEPSQDETAQKIFHGVATTIGFSKGFPIEYVIDRINGLPVLVNFGVATTHQVIHGATDRDELVEGLNNHVGQFYTLFHLLLET